MNRRTSLSLFLLLGLSFATSLSAAAPTPQKILFLGNSITKHGPKADIGWTGNWGMAASAEDKDYVHLVTKGLTKTDAPAPQTFVQNIAEFERNYATFDLATKLKDAANFAPTLIILAIGENVPALKNDEEKALFTKQVTSLLTTLKGPNSPKIIVRSSFWQNAAKDQCLKQACDTVGGIFVNIAGLDKVEANYARSERPFKNEGVARHPGDRGMQAIADAIVKAVPQP
ncbi:SGNH/GDSL hydrolase family protein [Verrucomicrobium spinosum]|uniref:SGNH/GDSL hydrolase family protein n=1 Tax=Verrucomicrobium spinosum TaxID=2736 RepID=UPI0001744E49|nr:SGNH/GDSL hydrolase family protein [Verrucomicrobium spinosum]